MTSSVGLMRSTSRDDRRGPCFQRQRPPIKTRKEKDMQNIAQIKVKDLTKTFRESENRVVRVLDGVNLSIAKGKITGIVGACGTGKTTLLHIMASIEDKDAGDVLFEGRPLPSKGREARVYRNRKIGIVLQRSDLTETSTAAHNVAMPMMVGGYRWRESLEKAKWMLGLVRLRHKANSMAGNLSGGEAQCVALARALINDPEILFADEPTGNLDWQTGQHIMQLIKSIQEQRGLTVVIVTHDMELAKKHCDMIWIFNTNGEKTLQFYDNMLVNSHRGYSDGAHDERDLQLYGNRTRNSRF